MYSEKIGWKIFASISSTDNSDSWWSRCRLTAIIFQILKLANLNPDGITCTCIFHEKAVTSEIGGLGTVALHASNPTVKTSFQKWVFESFIPYRFRVLLNDFCCC